MADIKETIAENIIKLRRSSGMTQAEMADILNYSDKAISKWERGGSTPDISNLKAVADLFNVTVDFLITPHPEETIVIPESDEKKAHRRHTYITLMSILMVWIAACVVYSMVSILFPDLPHPWLVFLYFVPIAMVVWLICNSVWFNKRRNYFIISLLVWSVFIVITIHISVFTGRFVPWFLITGAAGQLIVIWWSRMNR
ncbi:MAG: helix-turn-helix transcriptional regulator [Lachnospiraceae bacterium]|nr:helix-turn-helix transcriptional regulator [Lachnospiraceae bacterium]